MRPGVKGTVTSWPAFFAACSTPAQPASTIRSASETFLPPDCGAVELALDAFQRLQHLRQLGGLVDFPILLRRQANAGAVRAAALVGAAERGRRRPGGRNQLRDGQAGRQDLALQRGDVLRIDQLVIHRGNRVLPDEFFRRNLRAEITRARAHVAVRQLEPRPGERVGELVRDSPGSAARFFRKPGRTAARGRWSASTARCCFDGSCACGTVPAPAPFFGLHWCAPAGLFVSSHS